MNVIAQKKKKKKKKNGEVSGVKTDYKHTRNNLFPDFR